MRKPGRRRHNTQRGDDPRVREVTDLPVMVMIRPRGGDFCYDRRELYTMQCELEAVLNQAVAGVVLGALTPEGRIDPTVCLPLCRQAAGLRQTFHRAFDQTPNAQQALQQLLDLPFDRLLSSGQSATAVEGISVLRELVQSAAERIVVMPGAGIRAENARQIVQQTGATEIHFTAGQLVESPARFYRETVPMSAERTPGDRLRRRTSEDQIRAIRQAVSTGD